MRPLLRFFSIAFALCTALGAAAGAQSHFTDGQHVVLRGGTVRNFDGITASDGTKYVVFLFAGHTVLAKGRPDLYEGEALTVRGTYRAVAPPAFDKPSWRGAFNPVATHKLGDVILADPGSL